MRQSWSDAQAIAELAPRRSEDQRRSREGFGVCRNSGESIMTRVVCSGAFACRLEGEDGGCAQGSEGP